MRKKLVVLVALAVAFVPAVAGAAKFVGGREYASSGSGRVNGNLYIAASTVSVGSDTTGDLVAAGGTVSVTGNVGGDILAGGGTIQLLGTVAGDVRVVGGQVTVSQRIDGDLVVAGGTVHLLPSAVVGGDVSVAGGQILVDGTVNGTLYAAAGSAVIHGSVARDVRGRFGKLELGSEARIGGNLVYRAPGEAVIASGARIVGTTTFTAQGQWNAPRKDVSGIAWGVVAGLTSLRLLIFLGAAALVVWRFRRPAMDVMEESVDKWWLSVGRGLAYAILIPLAFVLLFVSIVGIIPGGIMLAAYAMLWLVTKSLAGVLLGSLVVMAFRRTRTLNMTWYSALGGVILWSVLGFIPLLGWIAQALISLSLFGVLARRAHQAVW